MSARGRWAEAQLRYAFKDASLLDLALTHRSASKANNERLEYLGDSFLNFTIARRLFELRPDDTEGDLSRARAALVKQPTLAAIGLALGVDAHLTLGAGELRSGGAQRAAILADAVEALIGAVLLDGGAAAAEAVVDFLFAEQFESSARCGNAQGSENAAAGMVTRQGLPLAVLRGDGRAGTRPRADVHRRLRSSREECPYDRSRTESPRSGAGSCRGDARGADR